MKQLVFGLTLIAATALMAQMDIAAYVWPAYQPEARWAELGIFGKGIGEWQNVQEAVSKWEGHKQPRVPVWGYENEADPKVVAKKIDAAVAAGVNVFIYDWYWYGSRPFLEDGLNEGFLKAENRGKMKFFLMWANHHVNWLWDNTTADKRWTAPRWRGWVSEAEFKTLAKRWIEKYFKEPNYYMIDGKPVLMIYELGTFVEGVGGLEAAARSLDYLRTACREAGFGGVHIMVCDYALDVGQVRKLAIDSASIYNFIHWSDVTGNPDYATWVAKGIERFDAARKELPVKAYFPHVSIGWDTNPRYPRESVQATVVGGTPAKFEKALREAKAWGERNLPEGCPRLITVNSWNEWTEGSYLEPDTEFGTGYLDAVRRVVRP